MDTLFHLIQLTHMIAYTCWSYSVLIKWAPGVPLAVWAQSTSSMDITISNIDIHKLDHQSEKLQRANDSYIFAKPTGCSSLAVPGGQTWNYLFSQPGEKQLSNSMCCGSNCALDKICCAKHKLGICYQTNFQWRNYLLCNITLRFKLKLLQQF